MNKISKKIVSLVTMAAFVLTLVPAAAFAAPQDTLHSDVSVSADKVVLDEKGEASVNVSVKTDADWTTTFNKNDQLAFWVGEGGQTYHKVTFEGVSGTKLSSQFTNDTDWQTSAWISPVENGNTYTVKETFKEEGTYDLYVGTWNAGSGWNSIENAIRVGTIEVADASALNVDKSQLLIDEDTATAAANEDEAFEVEFNVVDNSGAPSDYSLNAVGGGSDVYVWVQKGTTVVDDATFTGATQVPGTNLWKVDSPVVDATKIKATFNDAGDGYSIHAGIVPAGEAVLSNSDIADIDQIEPISVNVAPADVEIDKITFNKVDGAIGTPSDVNGDNIWNIDINDNVTASGVKVYTVTGYAYTDADTKAPAANKELSVTAKRGIELQGLSEEGTVKTNARGAFEFSFTMNENGEYDIVVSEVDGDASATLRVNQDAVYVGNIKTVKDGGYLLAANDSKHDTSYVGTSRYFADAVQFELTDVNGNEVTGQTFDKDTYTRSITKPDGSKLVADDLSLVWDKANGVYTLKYTDNDNTGITKDLIPGKYTVKVAFKSSDKAATASFNLAKFGTVQDIVLDMYAGPADWYNSSSNDAIKVIDDQVALGQSVEVVPSYVDENGIKVRANYADLDAGVNGEAVVDNGYHWYNGLLYFDTFANTPANNSLVGTTITVKVFDEENGKYVEKELTVVKNYLAETLSFDPTNGVVGEDNKVAVSVVDEEGNLSKVNGELHAYVEDQSNDDAYVELKVKNDNVKNGKGELTLYSDKEGTADVRVVVTANNGEMYGATLTYTFGAEDPNAENTVVMTIGSTDYVVNNDIIKGDAAPYVDAQWRTMVPFRVLGETFGAEVNWDQDTQTVTYTYGDTELTMTIGEETYTVNGTEKTMDTAPVLSGDRTFVPVRFVGEALGYTVTALQDGETGLTASVVFQK